MVLEKGGLRSDRTFSRSPRSVCILWCRPCQRALAGRVSPILSRVRSDRFQTLLFPPKPPSTVPSACLVTVVPEYSSHVTNMWVLVLGLFAYGWSGRTIHEENLRVLRDIKHSILGKLLPCSRVKSPRTSRSKLAEGSRIFDQLPDV